MDYQRKWSLRFNSHGNVDILLVKTLLPRLQAFKLIPRRSGVRAPGYVSTGQRLESTTTEGASVAEGKPEEANSIENSRKTTETETHSPLATAYACTGSRRSIPGKIWTPTNQIRVLSARAHVFRELLARALKASRSI